MSPVLYIHSPSCREKEFKTANNNTNFSLHKADTKTAGPQWQVIAVSKLKLGVICSGVTVKEKHGEWKKGAGVGGAKGPSDS